MKSIPHRLVPKFATNEASRERRLATIASGRDHTGAAVTPASLSKNVMRIGQCRIGLCNLPQALISYRDSLAIRERLAKSDPGNAGWQRDLSVSFAKLASVSRKLGARADALSALRQGHAIIVRITNLSPDNMVWKQEREWFEQQLKEVEPLH